MLRTSHRIQQQPNARGFVWKRSVAARGAAPVHRNRERLSAIRRAERRERFALYNEEFKCRQYCMQVVATRLEIEAHEERRLNRMQARFEKWAEEVKEAAEEEAQKFEELVDEAADRAEANKNKKKGKKK